MYQRVYKDRVNKEESNTLMATEEDFDFGTHETLVLEVCDEDESELEEPLCNKSHGMYIDIRAMTDAVLPQEYRQPELLSLIKAMANLTVKIDVSYVSRMRPRNWQGKENAIYPAYEKRGERTKTSGSGRIADVYQDDNEDIRCYCSACGNGKSADRESWIIQVFTATHVVYDATEAEHSECLVFYDTQDGGYTSFKLVKKLWANEAGDLSLLAGATCDRGLATQLGIMIRDFNKLWKQIRENYVKDHDANDKERLVVVVSHPHGQPKKVSFSKLKRRVQKQIDKDKGCFYTYEACTCCGSSGAPVYIYGQDWFQDEIVHSGKNSRENYSTTWCP
ncbi:hypothetical protein BgiMline_022102 [Biomphalaria glabrata]|uniref:Uncharacterized protein LOC106054553 isoform X4 n=2 Tax=Biomphalaria glabrata TaxID=6526 RepID=A0A9W3B592_BIOGL|nr:uncharacterized protein LOC106054553 isoform X4 [Biomphalaria glabrata]KAI8756468.1 hypothetical protein BgiMline_009983 [Biomphalaria glabrata]